MHWQTSSITILVVWVAVHWSTRVLAEDMSELQKSQLANHLNTLVQHPGWRSMGDVKIIINKNTRMPANAMAEILEAVSSNRKPVDESNVLLRYKDIWTVLMCKYAEVILKYRAVLQQFIRVCRTEKTGKTSKTSNENSYHDCFHSLLTKLHSMWPLFKYMADVLDLVYSLRPQSRPKHSVMIATRKLAEFCASIWPRTLSKLSQQGNTGTNAAAVELEIQSITEFLLEVFNKNLKYFTNRHCQVPAHEELSAETSMEHFTSKKKDKLIPQETTKLQYVQHQIDHCVDTALGKWFYDLGFAYDVAGNLTITTYSISDNI